MKWILLLAVALVACRRICFTEQYHFTGATGTFYPQADSIRVGDTLWYMSSCPAQFLINCTATVDFSHAENVAAGMHVFSMPYVGHLDGAIDSFDLVPVKGTIARDTFAASFRELMYFKEEGQRYQFLFGMIARKKGVYDIVLLNFPQLQKKCSRASVEVKITNTDTHSYILEQLYYPGSPNADSVSEHAKANNYCFKVY